MIYTFHMRHDFSPSLSLSLTRSYFRMKATTTKKLIDFDIDKSMLFIWLHQEPAAHSHSITSSGADTISAHVIKYINHFLLFMAWALAHTIFLFVCCNIIFIECPDYGSDFCSFLSVDWCVRVSSMYWGHSILCTALLSGFIWHRMDQSIQFNSIYWNAEKKLLDRRWTR